MKNRYIRQILFSPLGKEGQKKLSASRVTIIGIGGLGSVIASTLARAGIGFIRVIDNDFPELANLHRQILFDESDLTKKISKSVIAKERLKKINSDIKIEDFFLTIDNNNINEIIKNSDIVLDGTDNFKTKFLINKACVDMKIPFVLGSAAASSGIIYSVIPYKTPCLKCIFPKIPEYKFNLTALNSGVLNVIVNIVASIQATEAIKYLTGNYAYMIKGLMLIDIWDYNFDAIDNLHFNKKCPICR